MKIIVEGPDNSGKSTLIRHLSSSLDIPVVPGEGPGRSVDEINERVRRYATINHAIFDRHPCVSQVIYNMFRVGGPKIDDHLLAEFYQQNILFIYCVGRDTLEGQVIKSHDQIKDSAGVSHKENVQSHHLQICRAYEEWANDHANLIYRIGDGFSRVTSIIDALIGYDRFDPVADIADFHIRFGLEYDGPVRALPRELGEFRQKFMIEELDEYASHSAEASSEQSISAGSNVQEYSSHLEGMLDALVDEVYVVLGTSYLHGFNFREAWRRVHAANMSKTRAPNAESSKRGSTYDVIKPPGWEAPSHRDLVENNDFATRVEEK